MKQALTTVATPALAVVDGIATVSSLEVARHFGKMHKNVLRDIEALAAFCDAEFHRLNFEPMIREYAIGKGATASGPTYNLTRDGFALLAMGFTGEKAVAFKVAYIKAFNRMEAELSTRYIAPLANEKQFRNGVSMGLKFKMQDQAQKIMAKLMRSTLPPEQRFLHTQLRQVNAALGVPTESLEAMGLAAPAVPALEGGAA
jgi:Rha family phage regulatory protein